MVMIACHRPLGLFAFGGQCLCGGVGWNECVAPLANQVGAASLKQGGSYIEPVFRLEKLQKGTLLFAIFQSLYHLNLFSGHRIDAGVVHASGNIKGGRNEVLNLVGTIPVSFEEQCQLNHGLQITTRMAGNVIGNKELFWLTRLCGCFFESIRKPFEIDISGFLHQVENTRVYRFGCHLQGAGPSPACKPDPIAPNPFEYR